MQSERKRKRDRQKNRWEGIVIDRAEMDLVSLTGEAENWTNYEFICSDPKPLQDYGIEYDRMP